MPFGIAIFNIVTNGFVLAVLARWPISKPERIATRGCRLPTPAPLVLTLLCTRIPLPGLQVNNFMLLIDRPISAKEPSSMSCLQQTDGLYLVYSVEWHVPNLTMYMDSKILDYSDSHCNNMFNFRQEQIFIYKCATKLSRDKISHGSHV